MACTRSRIRRHQALRLPSEPAGACPAVGRPPYNLIAVTETIALRPFLPDKGCDYRPEAVRAIKDAPWQESTTQP